MPSQVLMCSVEPLQMVLQGVLIGAKAQWPAVSQPVAPQVPLVGLHWDEQQLPVPLIPQMPVEHSVFELHGAPGLPGAPEVLVTDVVETDELVTAVLVTEPPPLELLDELDELDGLDELDFELEVPPKPPRPPKPPTHSSPPTPAMPPVPTLAL
jgi:hypothetical protein